MKTLATFRRFCAGLALLLCPAWPACSQADGPPAAVESGSGGSGIKASGNRIDFRGGEDHGGYSVVDLELQEPPRPPLRLRLKIEPVLSKNLMQECSAELNHKGGGSLGLNGQDGSQYLLSLKLPRSDFTLAARKITVSGGQLSIHGVAFGAVAEGDVIELSTAGVSVNGARRGAWPE